MSLLYVLPFFNRAMHFIFSDVGEGHRAGKAAGQDAREPHVRLHGAEPAAGKRTRAV